MGFYIRKSFKVGPLGLNLSKGGLGVSAGVKGARLGVNSRGQVYSHVGRYGLYNRQTYGGGSQRRTARRGPTPTVEVEMDTGVTFGSPIPDERAGAALVEEPPEEKRPWVAGLLAGMGLLVVMVGCGSGSGAVVGVGVLLLLGALGWVTYGAVLSLRAKKLGQALDQAVEASMPPAELARSLEQIRTTTKAEPPWKVFHARRAYEALVQSVVADGVVDDSELSRLGAFEQAFGLHSSFVHRARTEGFRAAYLLAIADHELSEWEERALDGIRARLDVPADAIAEELSLLQDLAEVRRIRQGNLQPIEASVKLQRGEECYAQSPARLLKHKILKSYQRDGVRYKEMGFDVDKEGTLYVTSKRLLLVHQGTSTIRLDKVLDVDLDVDRALISIVKDGAKNPVYYTTPNVLKVGAVIAATAEV